MEIKYKKTLPNAPDLVMPKLEGDVGFDISLVNLISSDKIDLWVGGFEKVSVVKCLYDTGISIQPPEGYYFELIPRSSITKYNLMLSNSVGILDEGYQGSIKVCLYSFDDDYPRVYSNDEIQTEPLRLFQLVLRKNLAREVSEIKEVDSFESTTERNDRGFGSTG